MEEARAAALRVDPKTQQPLFHPQTGRSPLFDRNTAELPIGDYLFASRHEFDDMKERLRDMYSSHLRSLSNRKYALSSLVDVFAVYVSVFFLIHCCYFCHVAGTPPVALASC